MGAQRLSDRTMRKIARVTGLPVIRAWGGWYDLKTGEWGIETGKVLHYNTCSPAFASAGDDVLFPDGVPPLTAVEAQAQVAAWEPDHCNSA
jgi:hypothetical protein